MKNRHEWNIGFQKVSKYLSKAKNMLDKKNIKEYKTFKGLELFNNSPNAVALFKVNSYDKRKLFFECLDVNFAFAQMAGRKDSELVGRKLQELFPETAAKLFTAQFEKVADTSEPANFEHCCPDTNK